MKVNLRVLITLAVVLLVLSPAGSVQSAQSVQGNPVKAVTPGEFIVDPPTLINLGFEWQIKGDDNRNAAVAVSYRKKGETQW